VKQYEVKIDAFEGPLDLLLHLIQRFEIDIYDIPVSEITDQYVLYIHTMKELELDIASEYLVMAAELLAMKSKSILPNHEEQADWDAVFEEDPREELMNRLLVYKQFKEAANVFQDRESERAMIFTRNPTDLSEYGPGPEDITMPTDVTIYDMLGALQKLFKRKKLQEPLQTKIVREEISIERRMGEIVDYLKQLKKRTNFISLFPYNDKESIVVTFLAILELMKTKEIIVEQEQNFSDIFLTSREIFEKKQAEVYS